MNTTPITASIDIAVAPSRVYAAWADIAHWHLWDPETASASLAGPLEPGAKGWLTPRRGRRVVMIVDSIEPGRRLYVRCPVLGSALHFDHRLEPTPAGTRVVHQAWFSGWLAPVLRATVGRQIADTLPTTMASLRRYLEAGR